MIFCFITEKNLRFSSHIWPKLLFWNAVETHFFLKFTFSRFFKVCENSTFLAKFSCFFSKNHIIILVSTCFHNLVFKTESFLLLSFGLSCVISALKSSVKGCAIQKSKSCVKKWEQQNKSLCVTQKRPD